MKEITSAQNKIVKELVQLREKSRQRKKRGEFLVEGLREISLAMKGGYQITQIFFVPSVISIEDVGKLVNNNAIDKIIISNDVYSKLALRDSTEGIIALVKSKSHALKDLKFKSDNPLILIAESTEKPGNLGALLRTADAANIDAVIVSNPKSDFYNPNVIRSSVGCVFTTNIASSSNEELIPWLEENNIRIYSAALSASKPYVEVDFKVPSAIVVGTEATGLTEEWLNASTQNIIIPMEGVIDSMNVSVSAAIILFEAKRQRKI